MKASLLKYKNHLLLMLALFLANFILMPLTELQSEQQLNLHLLQNKHKKTKALFNSNEGLSAKSAILATYLSKAEQYLFLQENEANFKLTVQSHIETLLTAAGCNVSRIGFKGNQPVSRNVQKWIMEIRFKGDVECVLKTTRALEIAKPYINIEKYSYSSRGFDKEVNTDLNAILTIGVWHKITIKPNTNQQINQQKNTTQEGV
jgi:hypothetical protein